ncbi:MAG: spore cortex biosynthesis protein YabQ [Clostridia bacterium]|nr:spore cortex biosynthesis protein YabQ [Clostridia bacterium]
MSEITFFGQTGGLFSAIVMGVALCLFYDLLRIFRLAVPPGKILAFFEDVLWFFVAAVVTYLVCLAKCNGEVRSYVLVGEAVGFLLCRLTVSRGIMTAAKPSIRAVKKLARRLKNAILRFFTPIISGLTEKIQKILHETRKKEKKHLQTRARLLYNRKKKNILKNTDSEK